MIDFFDGIDFVDWADYQVGFTNCQDQDGQTGVIWAMIYIDLSHRNSTGSQSVTHLEKAIMLENKSRCLFHQTIQNTRQKHQPKHQEARWQK